MPQGTVPPDPRTSEEETFEISGVVRHGSVITDEAGAACPSAQPLPHYPPDDGPLTDAQMDQIRQMVPQNNYKPTRSLFLDLENEMFPHNADQS